MSRQNDVQQNGIAVIYCSQTGHTRKYAEWIAEGFSVEAVPLNKANSIDISTMHTVIFCSWFHASGLVKASWLKKQLATNPTEKFVVLSVGATPMPCDDWPASEHEQAFRNNFPESEYPDLVHFYAQGGFEFGRLGAFDKVAMRIYFHMLEKEKEENPRNAMALKSMKNGFDGTNKEYLEPLFDYVRARMLNVES